MTTPNIEELRKLAESAKPKPIGNMASQQEKSAHMTRHMDARMALARAMEPEHVITMCDFMQSQAERIKVIERESEMRRIELHDVMLESAQLRAQLAEIAATEPVAYMVQFSPGSRWVELTKEEFDSDLDGHIVYKKQAFFTRPMPAQDVEASMIKLPEPDDTYCGVNYYTESQLKQAVRDALDALKDVAQTLAWMQHGKCRGFSDGLLTTDEALDKARTALAKYKGAKQ